MDPGNVQSTNLLSSVISHMNKFLKSITNDSNEVQYDSTLEVRSVEVVERTRELAEDLLSLITAYNREESQYKLDPSVVQITASNKQLHERISAFISHAQNAVDEQNVKEFCSSKSNSNPPGCARTDACYKPRAANSTHMQVSKASNIEGPQLQVTSQGAWRSPTKLKLPRKPQKRSSVPQPIDERLCNLEEHLNVKSENLQSSDVYSRLKNLEDRLLHIEGTSPEYLTNGTTHGHPTVNTTQKETRDLTLQEIDDRIRQLKEELIVKKRKQDEGLALL